MKENETVQLTKNRTELLEDKNAEYFLQTEYRTKERPVIGLARNDNLSCKKPYIPEGFEYVKGRWDKNFTIRNKEDGSEFVSVPVEALEANGTLDGVHFCEKFGRRKCFHSDSLTRGGFYEPVDYELWESIKKYGMFYISAHLASRNDYELVFKKGNKPLCIQDPRYVFEEGKGYKDYDKYSRYGFFEMATNYAKLNSEINSCLPNGAVYDTIFQWIVQSGDKTYEQLRSSACEEWGNFWSDNDFCGITITGSNEKWSACGIYDLAGNCSELSREKMILSSLDKEKTSYVERGGCCSLEGHTFPTCCSASKNEYDFCVPTSFRVVLYKK